MGIPERRAREKEQRRNFIIDAAEQVFFTKGISAATMDDVAEKAELSKGTLYLYFSSKEQLYLAIHLRGLKILGEMFEEAFQKAKTGIEKISAIGAAYYQFSVHYPNYFNALIYYESHEINPGEADSVVADCHVEGQKTLGFVIQAIQVGIQDGTIRSDIDPVKTAIILWGQNSGLIQLLSLHGKQILADLKISEEDTFEYSFKLYKMLLGK